MKFECSGTNIALITNLSMVAVWRKSGLKYIFRMSDSMLKILDKNPSVFEAQYLDELPSLEGKTYTKNVKRIEALRPGKKRRSNIETRAVEESMRCVKQKYRKLKNLIEKPIEADFSNEDAFRSALPYFRKYLTIEDLGRVCLLSRTIAEEVYFDDYDWKKRTSSDLMAVPKRYRIHRGYDQCRVRRAWTDCQKFKSFSLAKFGIRTCSVESFSRLKVVHYGKSALFTANRRILEGKTTDSGLPTKPDDKIAFDAKSTSKISYRSNF